MCKYRTVVIDEEEKAGDLVLFLDILANIMSKDLLLSAVYQCKIPPEPFSNISGTLR